MHTLSNVFACVVTTVTVTIHFKTSHWPTVTTSTKKIIKVHFPWAWCFRTYRGQVRLVTSTFPLRSLLQPMCSTAMEHWSTSPPTKYLKDLLWVCLLLVVEFTCDYTGKVLFYIRTGFLLGMW